MHYIHFWGDVLWDVVYIYDVFICENTMCVCVCAPYVSHDMKRAILYVYILHKLMQMHKLCRIDGMGVEKHKHYNHINSHTIANTIIS